VIAPSAAALAAVPAPLRETLRREGSARLYLVGGFVRDAVLGRPTHDMDVAVAGEAQAVGRRLARELDGALVPLDPERGTYRIALRTPIDGIEGIDLTQLRAGTIEDDLRLRDFTINALAVRLDAEPALLDPTHGLADLTARRLRAASPRAFADDPLRLLRLVRFHVELGFDADEDTFNLALAGAPALARSAAERRRDEFARILASDEAYAGVRMLDRLGLLSLLLPELESCRGVEQPKEHYYDVFEHCLHTLKALALILAFDPEGDGRRATLAERAPRTGERALPDWLCGETLPRLAQSGVPLARLYEPIAEQRPRSAILKLAGLLHDVSKPETKTIDPRDARIRFFGHDHLGAERAAAALRRLRFASKEVEYVALLVDQHLRPGMLAAPGQPPMARALYRFARDLGDAATDLFLLNLADHAAAVGPGLTRAAWRLHVDYAAWVLRILYTDEQVARPPKLIDGHELMRELGLQPGPVVGRLLEAVREAQAAGEVRSREQALALARRALTAEAAAAPQE